MKRLLITIATALLCYGAFGQGRVQFSINYDNLIYFASDASMLGMGDRFTFADDGFGCGPVPIAGSSAYTGLGLDGTPGTVMSLFGSLTYVATLYAGLSSAYLSPVATTTIGDINNPGGVAPVDVELMLPAGTSASFQVQVYDSRGTSTTDAWGRGLYAGQSPIFTATPSDVIFSPIWLRQPPVNSTWAPGFQVLADLAPECVGPGFRGGIELWGCLSGQAGPTFIDSEPQSTTKYWGQDATFTVIASGYTRDPRYSGLVYQWLFNGKKLYDGPHISGSATAQLTVQAITLADAGSYQVGVEAQYNTLWGSCAYSSNAILTVLGNLSIVAQPKSQVGYWGQSVAFNVSAAGDPLPSYQWQKDGASISGATGASLVLTNLQATNAGLYTVIVSNSLGSVTSSNAYLTVNPPGVSLVVLAGLTIDGVAGQTYGIQSRSNLTTSDAWQGMTNLTLDSPTRLWLDVLPATQPQRYYRVVPGPISTP